MSAGPIFHGGGLDAAIARHGGRREDWLDLSTCINPTPWPMSDLAPQLWQQLPDSNAIERLLAAARAYYRVHPNAAIVVGNGTQALISVLPQVLPAKRVAVVSPTYGEHAHVWQMAGAKVLEFSSLKESDDEEVLIVVNPNNPDGRRYSRTELIAVADRLDRRDGVLVVDEAFVDCFAELSLVPDLPDNAIALRSFGKFFGLAGLRLGFAICRPDLARRIESRLGPWAVSGPALAVGAAALADRAWIEKTRQSLEKQSEQLAQILHKAGLKVIGEHPLFILARHPRADCIAEALANKRILVRPYTGAPDRLRFGLPAERADFERLAESLDRALERCS